MTTEKQLKELSQIELSKTSDFLKAEYNFDLNDLLHNVKVLNIEEKPQIKSFQKMFELQM